MTTVHDYINVPNMLKWIEELETTTAPQTTRQLRTSYGDCCLGIACAVLGIHGNFVESQGIYQFNEATANLPQVAHSLLVGPAGYVDSHDNIPGVTSYGNINLGKVRDSARAMQHEVVAMGNVGPSDRLTATGLNDTFGFTFKEIAAELRRAFKLPKITLDLVEAEVRRLAAAKPDYIYKKPVIVSESDLGPWASYASCLYIDPNTNKGSCIFGQALSNLGFTFRPSHEGGSVYNILREAIPGVSVPQWFTVVQRHQDGGQPWAVAVALADYLAQRDR